MTTATRALLAGLEADAKTAQAAEEDLRKSMAEQVKRLERQRMFAFRRARLIRTLADAVNTTEAEAEAEIWTAQWRAVRDDLGWTGPSEAYDAILVQLQPVGGAVWRFVSAADPQETTGVLSELEAFETWFEGAHGKSFYVLFDQYVQEVPVVDF